ncbi:MAG: glycosyltransferase family 39 protein, partial [bacterium]
DEAANYYFTKLFAEEGVLSRYEGLNGGIAPVVHPRSINVNPENYLVPGSFLGIILIYGFIAKILGSGVIIYLTAFFAALSALFFYGIIKKVFSRDIAFVSAVLMLSHPIFYYYSTRGMFHNVLFISLLIIGIYFLIYNTESDAINEKSKVESQKLKVKDLFFYSYNSYIKFILAGFFIGLALITRTSEAPWIMAMLLILWVFYFKRVSLFKVFLLTSVIFTLGLSVLCYNQILYGNPLITGYANLEKKVAQNSTAYAMENKTVPSATAVAEKNTKEDGSFINKVKRLADANMPAALIKKLDFNLAAKNFYNYFIKFFPVLSGMLFISFVVFAIFLSFQFILSIYGKFKKIKEPFLQVDLKSSCEQDKIKITLAEWQIEGKKVKSKFLYTIIFILISAYLVIYYGSWVFYDTPNAKLITIGTSYTRYWLPIYIMSMPFIAFLLVKISDVFKYKFPKFAFLAIVLSLLIIRNICFAYFAPYEGIKKQMEGSIEYYYKREKVLRATATDAVIINQYYDKLFFPDRNIIASKMYDDKGILESLPVLVKRVPVYYYSFGLEQADIDYINRKYLSSYNLRMTDENIIFKNESLWKIEDIK